MQSFDWVHVSVCVYLASDDADHTVVCVDNRKMTQSHGAKELECALNRKPVKYVYKRGGDLNEKGNECTDAKLNDKLTFRSRRQQTRSCMGASQC
jgi:hypothetical protein